MIFDTTYTNKEFIKITAEVLGNSFSLLERIKYNGIGSGRLVIYQVSKQLNFKTPQFSEINYANIEMRPKGVIIHITNRQMRYAWLIPFYKLHVFKTSFYSIHSDGVYIQFLKDKNYMKNKKFLVKMLNQKNEFLQLGYYD